jgi:hypothetical protein
MTAIGGGALVLALAGGGAYYSKNKSNQVAKNNNPQSQSSQEGPDGSAGKDTNFNTASPTETNNTSTNNPSGETPQPTSGNVLNDVTIQAVIDKSTGEIFTSLYGASGEYTVEKQVNGEWKAVVSAGKYSGFGGLDLVEPIPSTELQRVYRVYKIVNGQKTGPKEITVERNFVKEKGSASFPSVGAL